MNKQQRELVKRELAQRELAKRNLQYFAKYTKPDYIFDPFHVDLFARLQRFSEQVVAQESPRLLLTTPPRHGKSQAASVRMPAWHLGRNPTHEVILASYGIELSVRASRDIRDIFSSPEFQNIFEDVGLDKGSRSAEAWLTSHRGGLKAAGVGGGITGMGAHVFVIDDPIKNMEEADNRNIRDKIMDWYQSVAMTRLAPGGGMLVIQTRWNDDDLAGRLKEYMATDPHADQFEIVDYAAISDEYEYISPNQGPIVRSPYRMHNKDGSTEDGLTLLRGPNEPLSPSRYPLESLIRIKANMYPRVWSALYQQKPVPEEGEFFKKENMIQTVYLPQKDYEVVTAWDLATSEKRSADYTVGASVVRDHRDTRIVADVIRGRMLWAETLEAMVDTAEYWLERTPNYKIGVEGGAIWNTMRDQFMARCRERKVFPVVMELKAATDKVTRANTLQNQLFHKRVLFLKDAPWYTEVEREILKFPAGRHDDIVDALSWAMIMLEQNPAPRRTNKLQKPKSWKDSLSAMLGSRSGGSHMSA